MTLAADPATRLSIARLEGSRARRYFRKVGVGGGVALRLLFGVMWFGDSILWMTYDDPTARLQSAIERAVESDRALVGYRSFLEHVVLPHPGLFTGLVTAGEMATGAALLTGLPYRAGAIGGIFLASNYGLAFDGRRFPPTGNLLLALLHLPLLGGWARRWTLPLAIRRRRRA